MKIVDANVLLYAVNSASSQHEPSRSWLDDALSGHEPVGLPWVSTLAFLRLSTRSGLFPRPLDLDSALGRVDSWLSAPTSVVPEPTPRHADLLAGLLRGVGTGGNLVSDAHLAVLAIEHRATVVTWDRDFARFPDVRVELPGS